MAYDRMILKFELNEAYRDARFALHCVVEDFLGHSRMPGIEAKLIAKLGHGEIGWCAAIVEITAWQYQDIRYFCKYAGKWRGVYDTGDRCLGRIHLDFSIATFAMIGCLRQIPQEDVEVLISDADVRSPTFRDRKSVSSINSQGGEMLPQDFVGWKLGDCEPSVDYRYFLAALRERKELAELFPDSGLIHEPKMFRRLGEFGTSNFMRRFSEATSNCAQTRGEAEQDGGGASAAVIT